MSFTLKDLLNNQIVLYVVAFLALTSIFGYLMRQNYSAILFFILVAFLTNYFSKNMIIILGVALIATNLLAGVTNLFPINEVKEGFEAGSDKCNSLEKNKCNVEGCKWDQNKNICIESSVSGSQTLNPAPLVTETETETIKVSETYDKAKKKRKSV